jgi:hypothetical protein
MRRIKNEDKQAEAVIFGLSGDIVEERYEGSAPQPYTTRLDVTTGDTSCNCPGWTRGKKPGQPRHCKHCDWIRATHKTKEPNGMVTTPKPAISAPAASNTAPNLRTLERRHYPMLAVALTQGEFEDYCNDGWAQELKRDGKRVVIRVTAGGVMAWSRPKEGKEALPEPLAAHLIAELSKLPDCVVDGELELPGGKSYDVTRLENRPRLHVVLFDVLECLAQSCCDLPLQERRKVLKRILAHNPNGVVYAAEQTEVSLDKVKDIWAAGGEGVILKRINSIYRPNVRSNDWVKIKHAEPATLKIIGFSEGESGPFSRVLLQDVDGLETRCKTKNNWWLTEFTKNSTQYIGGWLVIRHYGRTPDNKYRGPILFDHMASEGEIPRVAKKAKRAKSTR